ncbi:C40 family peptidase [Acidovorax sp. HDW3]|uniref:C40 family peptidase n=1 Tax=Acidovorax sp. HDW3 TaxID=2714923 RepID=UPI001409B2B3|nr:C40 family peptidase [Acidovorax sp. HDW3]QIL45332.1 C40 family peptidase [Acidovorax sp. HDW3]
MRYLHLFTSHPRQGLLALACSALLLAGCSSAPPQRSSAAPTAAQLSSEQSSDIAIHALGLVGTPYRYGGNTPEGGFDCSGLIGYVYHSRAGVAPPRTVAQLSQFGAAVDADALRTGDLVVFGGARPSHAGIYVGQGRFVHAPSSGGEVRLDRLNGPYWAQQVVAFRRP